MNKEKRPLLEIVNRDHKSYFIKSNQADQKFKLTQNSLKKYLKSIRELKFCSFDDLMKVHNSVWQQKVLNSTNNENWQMPGQIICDCPRFLKSIAVSIAFLWPFVQVSQ